MFLCSHHPPCSSLSSCWESLAWQGQGWLLHVPLRCRLMFCSCTHSSQQGSVPLALCAVMAGGREPCHIGAVLERSRDSPPPSGAQRASAGPRGLQHCSSNIPSGAQPGVSLGPSLGREWG